MPEQAAGQLVHADQHEGASRVRMLADVREGLSRAQKELPPTYFYDAVGSGLFERITELPEYYLTRAEREILQHRADDIAAMLPAPTLAELGAGSATKTPLLIEALRRAGGCDLYVPIDVAPSALAVAAAQLRARFPALRVRTVVADMREGAWLPSSLPRPVLFSFLGSTIGNFEPPAAHRLLASIRRTLHEGDALLLGADLVKDSATLIAAYDDADGVTAAFNLNVLRVLNRELEADFDIDLFAHSARWNPEHRRIEMHLVASRSTTVRIPGAGTFWFAAGESIRTEVSCKYDRETIERLLRDAGFAPAVWMTDARGRFALTLARVPAAAPPTSRATAA